MPFQTQNVYDPFGDLDKSKDKKGKNNGNDFSVYDPFRDLDKDKKSTSKKADAANDHTFNVYDPFKDLDERSKSGGGIGMDFNVYDPFGDLNRKGAKTEADRNKAKKSSKSGEAKASSGSEEGSGKGARNGGGNGAFPDIRRSSRSSSSGSDKKQKGRRRRSDGWDTDHSARASDRVGARTPSPGNSDDRSKGSDDDDDQDNTEDDWPSAPPIDILDHIKGYEMVSFDTTMVPPPPMVDDEDDLKDKVVKGAADQADGHETGDDDDGGSGDNSGKRPSPAAKVAAPQLVVVQEIESKLSEEQARSALLSYIGSHCCYGAGAAKNMQIKKMDYVPAYHYELQTFCEKRETAWTYAAIRHGYADILVGGGGGGGGGEGGCYGGVPPLPWEIVEEPVQLFKDEVRMVQVPNTASTKACHRCRGNGGMTCRDCNGKGWSRCLNCHGDGWLHDSGGYRERCFYCHHSKHGHGHLDCPKCNTKGKVACATCEGHGQIRCFIQLSITWKVHTAEHIIERLDLPQELVRDVSGQVAFEEEAARVKAVEAFDSLDGGIKEASTKLVFEHLNCFADQKVIRQRHQVRIVPVTRITYEWKGKLHQFFVYGYENKIYLPEYPQKCCWGCNVL